jgi:hypothetical protein
MRSTINEDSDCLRKKICPAGPKYKPHPCISPQKSIRTNLSPGLIFGGLRCKSELVFSGSQQKITGSQQIIWQHWNGEGWWTGGGQGCMWICVIICENNLSNFIIHIYVNSHFSGTVIILPNCNLVVYCIHIIQFHLLLYMHIYIYIIQSITPKCCI